MYLDWFAYGRTIFPKVVFNVNNYFFINVGVLKSMYNAKQVLSL